MQDYKQTQIYKHFLSQPDNAEFAFVGKMVEKCIPILNEYSKIFPKYTDHAGVHQLNILRIIGELLGEKLTEITTLEAAILILSTYLHDIGMVYTEAERSTLKNEENFTTFLSENSKANRIFILGGEDLTSEIAEWYCRWNHAKRVHIYLERFEREDYNCLKYKGVSLRTQIGLVCESHNWSAQSIRKDDRFITDFLSNKADLRFCSVLLRLADYFDFDDSRAPKSLFDYLGLNKPKTPTDEISRKEWLKHQGSQGFTFPTQIREKSYKLDIICSPKEITIEHEIRGFIIDIESELVECEKVMKVCSERWRNFKLPEGVKSEILSQGYTYGDFKFNLDQDKVLNLLMGENLYSDPYVFIRELLQNAIDTSRHREVEEYSNHNSTFKADAIVVSDWEDEEGYRWIRIDDFGMGMDKTIISEFLLKIGKSYYNSDDFKVKQYQYRSKGFEFTPISRFGIGILSCFIVGDRVEINTKSKNSEPVRLSVDGLQNFFTLQTGSDIPGFMPTKNIKEVSYRSQIGTSIAVRLNPAKEFQKFNVKDHLERWLFYPQIEVNYDGTLIGGEINDLDKPLCVNYTEWLTDEQLKEVEELMGITFPNGLGVYIEPYNISEQSFDRSLLKGQAVIIGLTEINCVLNYNQEINVVYDIGNVLEKPEFKIVCRNDKKEFGKHNDRRISISLPELSRKCQEIQINQNFNLDFNNRDFLMISHDGIKLQSVLIEKSFDFHQKLYFFGFAALFDKLRPELNAARDKISKLSWEIDSHINYALHEYRKRISYHSSLIAYIGILDNQIEEEKATIQTISNDKLVTSENGWLKKELFLYNNQKWNWTEIEKIFFQNLEFRYRSYDYRLESYLFYKANMAIEFRSNYTFPWVKSDINWSENIDLGIFKPLYFVPLLNTKLYYFKGYRNLNHPFSQWFIKAGKYLKDNYPPMFNNILNIWFDVSDPEKIKDNLFLINQNLDRIRSLTSFSEEFKPISSLKLKIEDIG